LRSCRALCSCRPLGSWRALWPSSATTGRVLQIYEKIVIAPYNIHGPGDRGKIGVGHRDLYHMSSNAHFQVHGSEFPRISPVNGYMRAGRIRLHIQMCALCIYISPRTSPNHHEHDNQHSGK
jgi:hypothetical protein